MTWESILVEPGVVHVHPLEDLIEHDIEPGTDCVCVPRVELVEKSPHDEDAPDAWMHVHHSLDGREATET